MRALVSIRLCDSTYPTTISIPLAFASCADLSISYVLPAPAHIPKNIFNFPRLECSSSFCNALRSLSGSGRYSSDVSIDSNITIPQWKFTHDKGSINIHQIISVISREISFPDSMPGILKKNFVMSYKPEKESDKKHDDKGNDHPFEPWAFHFHFCVSSLCLFNEIHDQVRD